MIHRRTLELVRTVRSHWLPADTSQFYQKCSDSENFHPVDTDFLHGLFTWTVYTTYLVYYGAAW